MKQRIMNASGIPDTFYSDTLKILIWLIVGNSVRTYYNDIL